MPPTSITASQPGDQIQQWTSHIRLAVNAQHQTQSEGTRRELDAIIVPAARPAHNLSHAAELARLADCWLLVLCSRDTQVDDVLAVFQQRSLVRAVAVEVPKGYENPLTQLRTSGETLTGRAVHEESDLSLKRNLGLLVSRMMGWRSIFFMDDDIRDLTFSAVRFAEGLLARYGRVAFRVLDYPDNSVVCHANRDYGISQDVFVGGSALAIACDSDLPFFPHIYNEDWFFLYESIVKGDIVCAGSVRQLPYDPYGDPGRAVSEELGDLLAEGLFARLHTSKVLTFPTRVYWMEFLEARDSLLQDLSHRARQDASRRGIQALAAIEAARERLREIGPDRCAEFVELWQRDLGVWRRKLNALPAHHSLDSTLTGLGLFPAFARGPIRVVMANRTPSRLSVPLKIEVLSDVPILRMARLAALSEAPHAFSSSLANELSWGDCEWSRFAAGATWYCARSGEEAVSIAGVILEARRPILERHVTSMWVDPAYRYLGVGASLLRRIGEDAARDGADVLTLWVLDGNQRARGFYERLGFKSTSQRQRLPGDPEGRVEERLYITVRWLMEPHAARAR